MFKSSPEMSIEISKSVTPCLAGHATAFPESADAQHRLLQSRASPTIRTNSLSTKAGLNLCHLCQLMLMFLDLLSYTFDITAHGDICLIANADVDSKPCIKLGVLTGHDRWKTYQYTNDEPIKHIQTYLNISRYTGILHPNISKPHQNPTIYITSRQLIYYIQPPSKIYQNPQQIPRCHKIHRGLAAIKGRSFVGARNLGHLLKDVGCWGCDRWSMMVLHAVSYRKI